MKAKVSILVLRVVALVPVVIALVILAFAALFSSLAVRDSLWILFALSIVLVACAVILFRTSYLVWRRPSPTTVREVCEWTGYSGIGLGFVAFERLHTPGQEWLAWAALIASFLAVAVVESRLTRFLMGRLFGIPKVQSSTTERLAPRIS